MFFGSRGVRVERLFSRAMLASQQPLTSSQEQLGLSVFVQAITAYFWWFKGLGFGFKVQGFRVWSLG